MRVGEKEVSERAADRRALRRPVHAPAARRAPRRRVRGGRRRRARAALPASQDVRVGAALDRAGGAPGRARERDPRRARHLQGRGDAAADRAGPHGRDRRLRRPGRARRPPGRGVRGLQRRAPRRAPHRGDARGRADGGSRPDRAHRGGEGHLAARPRARARRGVRPLGRRVRRAARALVREAARPGARRPADLLPHGVPAPALAARAHVHEGARGRGLPRDARPARLRPLERAEHPARPRRPAAEVAPRVRDRLRPAVDRAPDHACPGRAPRLPGVPARGRARAPLRGRRPRPAVYLPQPLARSRADRDLLVHPRGDLARARLARRALRPGRRAGGRERRGDHVPRGRRSSAATPPSSSSSSSSGRASATTAGPPPGTPSGCRPRPASATGPTSTCRTWTRASTRPTTSVRGSARRSSAPTSSPRSARTGGGNPGRASCYAALWHEGTRPSSEEIAGRIGFEPLDIGPLLHELGA